MLTSIIMATSDNADLSLLEPTQFISTFKFEDYTPQAVNIPLLDDSSIPPTSSIWQHDESRIGNGFYCWF